MIIGDPEKFREPEVAEDEGRTVDVGEAERLLDGEHGSSIETQSDETKNDAPSTTRSSRRRNLVRIAYLFLGICLLEAYLVRRRITDLEFLNSLVLNPGHPEAGLDVGHVILNSTKSENLFLSIPNAKSALSASRRYATHPHLAGSAEDFEDAKVQLELFQTQFGIPVPDEEPIFSAGSPQSRNATLKITNLSTPKAWIDVYYPVLNTGLDRSLEILDEAGEAVWTADLVEDGDERDHEAAKYKDAVPTWHGLSFGGEAEGELIYANYGSKEDYDKLVESGVDLSGKIVLVRYGPTFRGLKIKGAQELGAAGVLIYSDPRDDGAVTTENGYAPYPAGPARNPTSVQRGSVQFISMYPGDPSTPGYPAYENATRIEGTNKPSIPSLPISWANAQRLFEEFGTPAVAGARPMSGSSSKRKIKLVNHVNDTVTPIWNTMAVIPGHIKDEVVIIGNHRDAWVMGAADPTSGTVSVHEVVRGFSALLRSGWKPLRTIVFASWDAEEYGLVGSTEWVEDFESWVSKHVVAYLNLDVSVAGSRWISGASPLLAHAIKGVALDIPHPTKPGLTLWDARNDDGPYEGDLDYEFSLAHNASQVRTSKAYDTGIGPLGSGSDFTAFLQRLGVPSCDEAFGGTLNDAPYHYHSIYDSQHWQEIFGDPGFHRHVAVAKHLGLLALRFADSVILPLNTTQYSLELDDYLDVVEDISSSMSGSTDLSPLRRSIKHLQKASMALDAEKEVAEIEFTNLLRELDNASHRSLTHLSLWDKIKAAFGFSPGKKKPSHKAHEAEVSLREWFGRVWSFGRDGGEAEDDDTLSSTHHDHGHGHHGPPHHFKYWDTYKLSMHQFIRAAKRVGAVNQKLIAFERGFISTEGIKDREWYKHLGVAPGKWLGYGATTLPALTEALTIDKNATLAEYEVNRLKELLDELARKIAV